MNEELKKELNKRGTAELQPDGTVNQVTQALDERPDKVKFMIFGELQEKGIMPIELACAKCWPERKTWVSFKSEEECRISTKKEAEARGFGTLICPKQFLD